MLSWQAESPVGFCLRASGGSATGSQLEKRCQTENRPVQLSASRRQYPERVTACLRHEVPGSTPMHSSQLCVARPPTMAVRSAVGRTGARCALHSYRVCRNLIIPSQARKRLSLMSAAHRAGAVAATEQVLAVCRNMPFQMSTAARADRGFGSRRKGGSDGSLQVVEPPVNLGRKTMCSCSRPSAQPPRVIADQMPSRRLRLNIVESYA